MLPALWLPPAQQAPAARLGAVLLTPSEIVTTQLAEALSLGKQAKNPAA